MSTIKLSEASAKAIKAYADVSIKADKALIKAVDSLYADGVTVDALTAPKKDADRSFYESVRNAVIAGFSESARKMVLLGAKDLPEVDESKAKANRDTLCKVNARYWQQQVGSLIKDMRNALERRLNRSKGSDGAEESKSSWEATKRKVLSDIITQAQKKEASKIKDISAFIKDLQSALARIPADA